MRPRIIKRRPAFTNLSHSDLSRTSATTVETSDNEDRPPPVPRKPTVVVLRFHQLGFNAMLVHAVQNPPTKAEYHISVHMNCFVPSSYITVVKRGSIDGDFVGSFEMGFSTQRATVNVHGVEKHLDSVLTRSSGKKAEERVWQWQWEDKSKGGICWHREFPVRYCYFMDETGQPTGPMIAVFTCPAGAVNAEGRQSQDAALRVHPQGLHVVDHILVSALVVERKRLTPPAGYNSMFS